jgi:hypothetical protein
VVQALRAGFLATSVLPFMLVGCGSNSSPKSGATPGRPIGSPSVAQEIRLAERAGPGFLDYCPLQAGRTSARFVLDVPGNPSVDGWCETQAVRLPRFDRVAFRLHWVGIPVLAHGGNVTMTYRVYRSCGTSPFRCASQVSQSGRLPP